MRALIFILCIIVASCGKQSPIRKELSGSDSLVINLNKPGTDSIMKTVTAVDSKAIDQFIGFVDGKEKHVGPCPLDGNIVFFKKGVATKDVSFSYSIDSCDMFVFKEGDIFKATTVSKEAKDFLQSLAEGKGWY